MQSSRIFTLILLIPLIFNCKGKDKETSKIGISVDDQSSPLGIYNYYTDDHIESLVYIEIKKSEKQNGFFSFEFKESEQWIVLDPVRVSCEQTKTVYICDLYDIENERQFMKISISNNSMLTILSFHKIYELTFIKDSVFKKE